MKTINVDAYKLIKKNDENSLYDILLCNTCLQTCMRCNFSRHKKSPKHLREIVKNNIPILGELINHKTFLPEVDDTEGIVLGVGFHTEHNFPLPLYI